MLVHVPEDAAPGSIFKAKTPSGAVWAFKVPEKLPEDRWHCVRTSSMCTRNTRDTRVSIIRRCVACGWVGGDMGPHVAFPRRSCYFARRIIKLHLPDLKARKAGATLQVPQKSPVEYQRAAKCQQNSPTKDTCYHANMLVLQAPKRVFLHGGKPVIKKGKMLDEEPTEGGAAEVEVEEVPAGNATVCTGASVALASLGTLHFGRYGSRGATAVLSPSLPLPLALSPSLPRSLSRSFPFPPSASPSASPSPSLLPSTFLARSDSL